MAKNKKAVAKPTKKGPAKSKTPVKAKKVAAPNAKKVPAKKSIAKAPSTKSVVAKKAAPKKVMPKKIEKPAVKPSASKIQKEKAVTPVETKVEKVAPIIKEKEKVEKPVAAKPAPVVSKPAPPQLTNFPVPNQRPIAHKQPVKPSANDTRTRYSENELVQFEALIHKKLDKAKDEYRILKETLNRNNDEGTDATSGGNTKVLEDGAETAEKENLSQLAARQQKYIMNLENALVRIKNGTYGICSVTGKLIPKERLIAVPHTTQSIEAKMMQQD